MFVRRVSQNIVRKYGQEGFSKLLNMLSNNIPCVQIAKEFQVTRQRVYQWKSALGVEKKVFQPYPDVNNFVSLLSRTRISV